MQMISKSPDETFAIGRKIGQNAAPGLVIAFYGALGAGKTVMTKGIAEGLGIPGMITSPTFTILQADEDGRLPLYHLDVYRIDDPDEMEEIGLDDCLYGGGVTVIEWAERIEELLPADTVRVTIERMPENPDYRSIRMEAEDPEEIAKLLTE